MRIGRIYEVFVNSEPVKLIGGTIRTLKQRRAAGYIKRFGKAVELHLIREVPRHESYSDDGYNIRLKSAEAFDIARRGYYQEDGGLNKISPLIQVLGHPMLEAEMGRISMRMMSHEDHVRGGKSGSREDKVKAGRAGSQEDKIRAALIGARNGGLITSAKKVGIHARTSEQMTADGRKGGAISGLINGRKNVESGLLASIRTTESCVKGGHAATHSYWHVRRNIKNPNCKLCQESKEI